MCVIGSFRQASGCASSTHMLRVAESRNVVDAASGTRELLSVLAAYSCIKSIFKSFKQRWTKELGGLRKLINHEPLCAI